MKPSLDPRTNPVKASSSQVGFQSAQRLLCFDWISRVRTTTATVAAVTKTMIMTTKLVIAIISMVSNNYTLSCGSTVPGLVGVERMRHYRALRGFALKG